MTATETAATTPLTPATSPVDRPGLSFRDRVLLGALLGGVRLIQLIPDGALYRIAAGIGTLAWLAMPARRALVRANLDRVCRSLVDSGQADERVAAAARNSRALDRLVRNAFQHWVRAYAESAVAGRYSSRYLLEHVHLETPETMAEALGPWTGNTAGRLLVGFHFGAIELAALYASRTGQIPVSGPMESVQNPVMRAYFERTRDHLGVDIFSLDDAANELQTRLGRGDVVALVADRAIKGAGSKVQLFGAPARLPIGPAVLTAESKARTYVVGMWRTGWGRWSARLDRIDIPDGLARKERIRAALDEEARLLERMVARAPDQWWSLLFPIWETPK